jgi:hypothetical protein
MSNLAETLRPETLDSVIGQDGAKKAIRSWIEKDNFPRCQLYTGPVGTGKSTLAGIVAKACQGSSGWEGADIRQINAGTVGKVDDARALAADSASRPFIGRYRVFVLEEAQRMTDAAQDAILIPMEFNAWTVWILTSSKPEDLLPAIRSRCAAATFELKLLAPKQMAELVERSIEEDERKPGSLDSIAFIEFLDAHKIYAPREILGATDQFLSGVPLEDCIHGAEHEPLYKDVAGAVLNGNWTKASGLLTQIKTADYRGMISVVSAFLRSDLVKQPVGPRADALATCLVGLGNSAFQDGVAYAATTGLLYKCAKNLGGSK